MDEDGKKINPPHIPQYMASAPWYFREAACENCGAVTHDKKSCRQKRAKWTGRHIALPYEMIEKLELDYDGKRDRWNEYDPASYERLLQQYEARYEARRSKFFKLQKLEEKK